MIDLGRGGYTNNKENITQIDEFKAGVNTLLRDTRIKKEEASEAKNLMLVQDGVWTQRWGTSYYTGDAGGSNVDGFGEYIKSDNTRELIIVANGVVRKKNGSSWTTISGATFTAGTKAYLQQINNLLFISNGTDPLAYYNGTSLSTYAELSAPAWAGTPLARGAGLSTGNYTQYYQVTALNSVGETVGADEKEIATDKERDSWVAADDEHLVLDWSAVSGAQRYQIYWADETGFEVLIGSTTDTTFTDDGTTQANSYIEVPDDNTTGAPKFTHMWMSDNRLWATGDPDNPYRVYFSGTGQFITYFSDYYGGGWIDLELGGRDQPKAGIHYHDGKGLGRSTVFAASPEGKGSVWQVVIGDLTVGDETFSVPSASRIVGSTGTSAPRSIVQVENDVFFFNKKGVFALGNEAQYWGILRTNELSVRIRPYIQSLDDSQLAGVSGYYYDGKVFFSVPTNSDGNNNVIYYDRERKSWVIYWTTGVSEFGEFTDSSGKTHFLGGTTDDGYLIEFTENIQGDLGVAFETIYKSARIPVNKDWTKFDKIKKAWIRLGEPQGAIEFSVTGTEKRRGLSQVGSETISPDFSNTGMGWDPMGTVQMGDSAGTPTTFAQGSLLRYLTINKRLRDVQFKVETSGLSDKYTLLGLQVRGYPIDTKPPSSEKL